MSPVTRLVVLIGDPQQLDQPMQGSHQHRATLGKAYAKEGPIQQ
jgi:hypothetical protein